MAEDSRNFVFALKFFEICNRAAFEIALATYKVETDLSPYTELMDKFKEKMTDIQESFKAQIKEYHDRLEFSEKET